MPQPTTLLRDHAFTFRPVRNWQNYFVCGSVVTCCTVSIVVSRAFHVYLFGNENPAFLTIRLLAASGNASWVSCDAIRPETNVGLHPVATHVPPTIYTDSSLWNVEETVLSISNIILKTCFISYIYYRCKKHVIFDVSRDCGLKSGQLLWFSKRIVSYYVFLTWCARN
jgi:hypothetical protein